MKKNLLIAQSGGPSPVINSSLRGVIEAAKAFPDKIGTVYAGWHGIEGVLKEELLDLSCQNEEEISLLRNTPAAGAIGTCRYKVKSSQQEDFERIIEVIKAHNIGYFLYNGGNDSMDTANKVAKLAQERGLDCIGVGVPKTIDNDVGDSEFKLIDHTPGYGSVARYWSNIVQNAEEENRGSCPADPVLVLQAMGRKIGFIPAAARLADPKRETPLLIFLYEAGLSMEQMADKINAMVATRGRAVVVVSEGCDVGDLGFCKDSFGHAQFGASETTVQQALVNYLNKHGIKARGNARGQTFGTDQRATAIYASTVDIDEAYRCGQMAVLLAARGEGGFMSTLLREPGLIYQVRYDKAPLELVANSERFFPKQWITADGCDVTDEFMDYVRPLIGEDWPSVPVVNGRQRFAQLKPVFADKKLPEYELQAFRKKNN
ncbi:MAG: diphosphate--fructose-6-phosphate 1-phosphotransferase [Victivallaceae bacterium]|jgi:6-phosphofructokinase 1|nr:diphosphate--fructose-6-phosphate 1-phosphotransferase [Victivallaceae bacterium]MDD3116925.1 diphosphate--fructose-6-phosphate 1-phosphotransferase [Victivallaceae bacterium]MDD3703634.1 diphosphate--fructose-6-phosphate 1-phosphotransferase [Victivallaceae bacterium]MDD4317071.1 diphosphate--fructose-6-phosphate 1-phosphotransferase [Victivallaceae bacterium]NLK83727.1 diphosphate--fructose-6-phosphate 1-phosphotransferase [Lentisphaerota bacterium]